MMLEYRNINHRYTRKGSEVQALSGINLKVEEGELLCIIGPSGCGKTSLLHMAAGLLEPEAGEVLFRGEPVTRPGRERAVVFQESTLMPWLNVKENILLAMDQKNTRGQEEAVTAALETVGLRGFDHAMPHELSGGMKQKVSIARSLVMESPLLLMDEPFSSLDEQTRSRMNRELIAIWEKSQKTIIFITHSIREALTLGTRVVLLSVRPGRIIEEWDFSSDKPAVDSIPFNTLAQKIRGSMGLCCPPKELRK